ncbi:MAG: HAD hydrolase-like protein, partial [Marmoricola sp.]
MAAQLVVGFDLDMTLIDTVEGFAATLEALGAELDVTFPIEAMTAKLGPPLEHLLREHLSEDRVGPAGDRFRALYPDTAVLPTKALRRAHDAIAAVRREHGRVLLVTGKHT